MNILLTGANGFIGSALLQTLLKNHKVTVLTANPEKISPRTLNINVIPWNDRNPKSLETLNLTESYDTCIHLAANTQYCKSLKSLKKDNVDTTIALYKLCDRLKIQKFIFASSIEAIGTGSKLEIPLTEKSPPHPNSTYGISKMMAENELLDLRKKYKTKLIILRIGMTYGLNSGWFIPHVLESLENKNPFIKRSVSIKDVQLNPVYITDVMDGILSCLKRPELEGTFILSGPDSVTVQDFIQLIANLSKKNIHWPTHSVLLKSFLIFRCLVHRYLMKMADHTDYFLFPLNQRRHRVYSFNQAKLAFDFNPKISLKDGVQKTISSFQTGNPIT